MLGLARHCTSQHSLEILDMLTSVSLTGGDHAVPPSSSILMISMLLSRLKPRSQPMMYVPVHHECVQLSTLL